MRRITRGVFFLFCCAALAFGLLGCASSGPDAPVSGSSRTSPYPLDEVDYTVVEEGAREYLGEGYASYQGLVKAILAREESYAFADCAAAGRCLEVLYTDFPLTQLLNLPDDNGLDRDTAVLHLTYAYSEEEHQRIRAEFDAAVKEAIQESVCQQDSELEKALALYRYTAGAVSYDYDALYTDNSDVSVYRAVTQHEGICQSYDGMYRFLAGQVGLECRMYGAFTQGGEAHIWPAVRIGGVYYHIDPTFESTEDGGMGLRYFGQNDAQRVEDGCIQPFSAGINSWCRLGDARYDIEEEPLSELQQAASFMLDREKDRILLLDEAGNQIGTYPSV